MGFYLWEPRCRQMTLKQRLIGLIYVFHPIGNIFTTLSILLMPLALLSGEPLVAYSQREDLSLLLHIAFAFTISEWSENCLVALIVGYSTVISEDRATFWTAPCKPM